MSNPGYLVVHIPASLHQEIKVRAARHAQRTRTKYTARTMLGARMGLMMRIGLLPPDGELDTSVPWIGVEVPADVHRAAKTYCAEKKISLRSFAAACAAIHEMAQLGERSYPGSSPEVLYDYRTKKARLADGSGLDQDAPVPFAFERDGRRLWLYRGDLQATQPGWAPEGWPSPRPEHLPTEAKVDEPEMDEEPDPTTC